MAFLLFNNTIRCVWSRYFNVSAGLRARPPKKPVPKRPVFERILPPKQPMPPYRVYMQEMLKTLPGGSESFSKLAAKWKGLRPEKKSKYFEESQQLQEEFQKKCQLFFEGFNSKEKYDYLKELAQYRSRIRTYKRNIRMLKRQKKIRKPVKCSCYTVMRMDRCKQYPVEERMEYIRRQAVIDYKNLTKQELAMYQHMADNIHEQRLKEHETKLSLLNAERKANSDVRVQRCIFFFVIEFASVNLLELTLLTEPQSNFY